MYCRKCKEDLPLALFEPSQEFRRHPICRGCEGNRYKSRRAKKLLSVKIYDLRKKYGMTLDQFEALFNAQGRRCAICGRSHPGWSSKGKLLLWHIDHDHVTKIVRGILCFGCNVGLGNFGDSPETCLSAAQYLLKSKPKS